MRPTLIYAFFIYTFISIATVLLAVLESDQHMGIYGFIAIFICQPWLGLIWLLVALGVPVPEFDLNALSVGIMAGLNIIILGICLAWLRKHHNASNT
jgi:hypothetical protein